MPAVAPGVKPSQFYDIQHGEVADVADVADVPDVQHNHSQESGVVQQGERGQIPENISGADTTGTDGGVLGDEQVHCQTRVRFVMDVLQMEQWTSHL